MARLQRHDPPGAARRVLGPNVRHARGDLQPPESERLRVLSELGRFAPPGRRLARAVRRHLRGQGGVSAQTLHPGALAMHQSGVRRHSHPNGGRLGSNFGKVLCGLGRDQRRLQEQPRPAAAPVGPTAPHFLLAGERHGGRAHDACGEIKGDKGARRRGRPLERAAPPVPRKRGPRSPCTGHGGRARLLERPIEVQVHLQPRRELGLVPLRGALQVRVLCFVGQVDARAVVRAVPCGRRGGRGQSRRRGELRLY